MKKDIEWAKKEIKELMTEESQNYPHDEMIEREMVLGILNQLDEPEVLSQGWIDENSSYASFDGATEEYVHVDDLKELLVPKQELSVIPWYVADWIEKYRDSEANLWHLLRDVNRHSIAGLKLWSWIGSENNLDVLARAWLDGYAVVEEEPLYTARLKVITDEYIASYLRTQSSDDENRLKLLEIGNKYIYEDYRHQSEFTEDELKELGIWDSEQWVVEEVEE